MTKFKTKYLKRLAETFGRRRPDGSATASADPRYAAQIEQLTTGYRKVLDQAEPSTAELVEQVEQDRIRHMAAELASVTAPSEASETPDETASLCDPKALAEQIAAEYRQAMKDTPRQERQAFEQWRNEYGGRYRKYYDDGNWGG